MLKILKKSKISNARLGRLETGHGVIQTPFFMPDATRAVLKNVSVSELKKLKTPAIVINTYHLYLQPKMNIIKKAGGVHKFMSWEAPVLSDSGGFQVFSLIHKNKKFSSSLVGLKQMGKIHKDKVEFKSPLDGSRHELTPEKSIQIQFDLKTDMMVCLDDCPPNNDPEKVSAAVERTINWAKRCKKEYERQVKKRKLNKKSQPLLFGVVQGGMDKKLRKQCADELIKIGFDGLGYGARPVDDQGVFLKDILRFTAQSIPENYIRFGLGIGMPEDIVQCVKMGWDMFDCVIPTREARHGRLYIRQRKGIKGLKGKFYDMINIANTKFAKDFKPINADSRFPELKKYTKAYLHYLFKINEPLGQRLAILNNLEFYFDLMKMIRLSINKGKF